MSAWLPLVLVVAYLGAAALPCAERDLAEPSPSLMKAYSAGALHAHGAAPETPDAELRAPCPCGCDEAPASAAASLQLGAVLLPSFGVPALPRAAHLRPAETRGRHTSGRPPEPVPRPA